MNWYEKRTEAQNVSYGGPSFISLLTLLFIGLKLTGYIDWSWWWVLSPVLFVVAIVILVIILAIVAEWWIIVRRNRKK